MNVKNIIIKCGVLACASAFLAGCSNSLPTQSLLTEPSQNSEQNHGFTDHQASTEEWWNIPYPTRFDTSSLQPQDALSVRGNVVVDESGKVFTLRGMNIADPSKLAYDKRWSKQIFSEAKRWGANTVRYPIHPLSWRKEGKDWHLARLDEAVKWANELGLYLILDWHSIGNLHAGMYQHPMYETDMVETSNFWKTIAFRYKDVPTIAVYELFNEPTYDYIGNGVNSLGPVTWQEWRVLLESLIDIVYAYDENIIPLVAGFNWAYGLEQAAAQPIRRKGIAYAVHPYPQKGRSAKNASISVEQFKQQWEKQWGFAAKQYPLMATEIGYTKADGKGAHVPVIHNENTYGPAIIEFMKERNISWTAWVFDPDWAPTMIKDWNYTPTEQGAFFKKALLEANQ